jgi:hypothetical protein
VFKKPVLEAAAINIRGMVVERLFTPEEVKVRLAV